MSNERNIFRVGRTNGEFDLDNFYQKQEAASMLFRLADQGFDGRLTQLFFSAHGPAPHGWIPQGDRRTAAMKRYEAASTALARAMTEYDNARRDAIEWAKVAEIRKARS